MLQLFGVAALSGVDGHGVSWNVSVSMRVFMEWVYVFFGIVVSERV